MCVAVVVGKGRGGNVINKDVKVHIIHIEME